MKTNRNALAAGAAMSGRITRRQRVDALAPRSCAASSSPAASGPKARVEHEHHVRQEDVHERDRDREAVVEQEAERLVDQSQSLGARS